jgi:uncharacterized membrane protein
MVWAYVIGYFIIGVIALAFGIFTANHCFSDEARRKLRTDNSEMACFVVVCVLLWWLTLPIHFTLFIAKYAKNMVK